LKANKSKWRERRRKFPLMRKEATHSMGPPVDSKEKKEMEIILRRHDQG